MPSCCPCAPPQCMTCYIWLNRETTTSTLHATLVGTGNCHCISSSGTVTIPLHWNAGLFVWFGVLSLPQLCRNQGGTQTSLGISFSCAPLLGSSAWYVQVASAGGICDTGIQTTTPGNSCTVLNESYGPFSASFGNCCGPSNTILPALTVTVTL